MLAYWPHPYWWVRLPVYVTVISDMQTKSKAVYNYMHALIVRGWWNLNIGSAPAVQAPYDVKCIESDSESAIYTVCFLGTVNTMVNLRQFYPYSSNLYRN